MMQIMAPTLGYYGELHGMDVLLCPEVRLCPERPAAWDKVVLIRTLLERYETVVWIDCDAIITDPSRNILDALVPGVPMYVVAHRYEGRVVPNTGVWAVQRDPRSLDLLDEVWGHTEMIRHSWWENAALMDLIGLDPRNGTCREFGQTPFSPRVGFLPVEWNSIRQDAAESPLIYHFLGEPAPVRLVGLQRCFGQFLARVTTGEAVPQPAARISLACSGPISEEIQVAALSKREHLPGLLNLRGLNGTGVEIGVKQGLFSDHLLRRWKGECLISIDPWMEDEAERYVDIANGEQGEHERYYQETVTRLAAYGGRSDIWRMTSVEAAQRIDPESLDFVYIDARHDYASVLEDLEAWIDKVRPGGIIAGHDYLDGVVPEGDFGVRSAVDEFFGARGLPVYATVHDAPWISWIVEVPRRPLLSRASVA